MKIVLVNYRYFFSGGPERYMFNIKELLEAEGHEVIPFSVQHNKNVKTPYAKYFLSPIGTGDEIYADQVKKNIPNIIKGIGRVVYSFEAKTRFRKLLEEVKPDIIYILCVQSKISYSIVDVAASLHIPVVHRISDFSLLCPSDHYYRSDINAICEDCTKKGLYSAVLHRCNHGSLLSSIVKAASLNVERFIGVKEKISHFVFTTEHTRKKFIEGGFDTNKLSVIPTMFNDSTLNRDLQISYKPYALFVGRIDPDKGIKTLLDAFIGSQYNLKLIGFSSTGYIQELQKHLEGKQHNIEFLGRMDFEQIQKYLAECMFTIIPSMWYDNLPNSILESYALRKCVVATKVGCFLDNVHDGKSGLLFDYNDSESLKSCINMLFNNESMAIRMGEYGRTLIDTTYNEKIHVNKLVSLFEKVVKNNS